MLRAIIVDDEKRSQKTLQELVTSYCPNVEVVGKADSVSEAEALLTSISVDLVFLDIEMPGGTGFDLLEKYAKPKFSVIFTTAYENYALKAIQMAALGYLLKPISIKELVQAVNRVEQERASKLAVQQYEILLENLDGKNQRNQNQKIAVPTKGGLLLLTINSITRCEAHGNYTMVYSNGNAPILTTRKIKEFEDLLSDQDFFRTHNSHLINLLFLKEYIRGDGGLVIMEDGTEVMVSRRKKDSFLEKLNRL